jgi:hypothetical protein
LAPVVSLVAFAALLIVGGRFYASRPRLAGRHRRGAQVTPHTHAQRKMCRRRDRAKPSLTLAGVAIHPLDETKHFKLIGTTGTGKSTAICELLGAALARGDRAIVTDPEGAIGAMRFSTRLSLSRCVGSHSLSCNSHLTLKSSSAA